MRRGHLLTLSAAVAVAGVFTAVGLSGGAGSGGGWTCAVDHVTNRVTVFNNSNGGTVENGATAPTFSTGGKAYCVSLLQTYHWNGGHGASPGTLGLKRVGGAAYLLGGIGSLGPYKALASSGQNNAPNVNWYIYPQQPGVAPQVIDGSYTCEDSGAATWSTTSKGGPGFCTVYGVPATLTAGGGTSTAATTTTPTTATVKCPTTGVFPPDCRYDLRVSVSAPSEISAERVPQRINVTVTVANSGDLITPRLPPALEEGLNFGHTEVIWEYPLHFVEYMQLSKTPSSCIDEIDQASSCSVSSLPLGAKESYAFKLLWTAADKAAFEEWSASHEEGQRFYIDLHANVNAALCESEEVTCANNSLSGIRAVEIGVVPS